MSTCNPLDILLKHDRWATRQILDGCNPLTAEQFTQKFEMGPGSLQATLTHILGAQRFWSDLLAGREQRARLEQSGPRTPAELIGLLEEIALNLPRRRWRIRWRNSFIGFGKARRMRLRAGRW